MTDCEKSRFCFKLITTLLRAFLSAIAILGIMHHERTTRLPDSIITPSGEVIPWILATLDQRNTFFTEQDVQQQNERKIEADTGHGKGSRKKGRPFR